jgi:hypothetical protein
VYSQLSLWQYGFLYGDIEYRGTRLNLAGNRLDIDVTRLNIEVIKPDVSPQRGLTVITSTSYLL